MLKDILAALRSIEGLLADILIELKKRKAERPAAEMSGPDTDKLLQEGIANILGYQAGKKREGDQ